jgi:hypothetical protein
MAGSTTPYVSTSSKILNDYVRFLLAVSFRDRVLFFTCEKIRVATR